MLAYHNDPKQKSKILAQLRRHAKADQKSSPSEMIAFALVNDLIRVDAETGLVYSNRWCRDAARGLLSTEGYVVFTLHANGIRRQVKAHQVVWMSVHGLIPAGLVLDHINRAKSDNRIANLRLATAKMNSRNRRSYAGSDNPSAKIDAAAACEIRRRHGEIRSYSRVAVEFNVSRSLVAQIVRGELWA